MGSNVFGLLTQGNARAQLGFVLSSNEKNGPAPARRKSVLQCCPEGGATHEHGVRPGGWGMIRLKLHAEWTKYRPFAGTGRTVRQADGCGAGDRKEQWLVTGC